MEPADQFYGDRNAGKRDSQGITWWIATRVENLVVYLQMDLVRTRDLGFRREGVVVVRIFGPDAERLPLNSRYNAGERRSREIAIRKVAGASEGHLMLRVAREFPILAFLAGAIACPAAYLLTRDWLRNFAYRIDLTVWPFLLSLSITLVVAIATVAHLARNAARTNPVDVLSQE